MNPAQAKMVLWWHQELWVRRLILIVGQWFKWIDSESNSLTDSYIDLDGMSNVNKYRLKLVHVDGRVIWSKQVEVAREGFVDKEFVLYPNPTTGRFTLRAPQLQPEGWSYQLCDQMGRVIFDGKLTGPEMAFDLGREAVGMYHVLLVDPQGNRAVHKIVKK